MSQTTVHLLFHDMDGDDTPDEALCRVLSDEERARAGRYRAPLHGRRYRVGRALLRRVLARWTGRAAAALRFELGPQGKPALPGGPAFNVSHCEGVLLIALAEHGRLGVDVELLRPVEDQEELAAAHFAAEEVAALRRLPAEERSTGFLRIWTRKEALIKAMGGGLSIPLRSFQVSAAEQVDEALECLWLAPEHGTDWSLRPVRGLPGVVAAVAIDTRRCELAWISAC